jgi:hypothetical protein
MHNTNITSFHEFRERLKITLGKLEQILTRENDPVWGSICRQLQHVQNWTKTGKRPNQEDLDKLSFGVMASYELHNVDRPLATLIYSISDFLVYWPSDIAQYDYAGQ